MGSENIISENQNKIAERKAWVTPAFELLNKDMIKVGVNTGHAETTSTPIDPFLTHKTHTYYS